MSMERKAKVRSFRASVKSLAFIPSTTVSHWRVLSREVT